MIVSQLNFQNNFAFQYHYISLLLLYILCPSDSRLGSAKCVLVSAFPQLISLYLWNTTIHYSHYKISLLNPNEIELKPAPYILTRCSRVRVTLRQTISQSAVVTSPFRDSWPDYSVLDLYGICGRQAFSDQRSGLPCIRSLCPCQSSTVFNIYISII
jgi:hypothetical protein